MMMICGLVPDDVVEYESDVGIQDIDVKHDERMILIMILNGWKRWVKHFLLFRAI